MYVFVGCCRADLHTTCRICGDSPRITSVIVGLGYMPNTRCSTFSNKPPSTKLTTSAFDGLEKQAAAHPTKPDETKKDANEGEKEEVVLEGSMWHVGLLIGTHPVGAGASAMLVLLMMINLIVQAGFLFVVVTDLSEATVSAQTVEGLKNWRRTTAHHYQHYNALMGESMASRLCSQDSGLDSSASQSSLFTDLKNYLGEGDAVFFGASGPMMTTLALFTWLCTISKEFSEICLLARALWRIPQGTPFQPQHMHTIHKDSVGVAHRSCRAPLGCLRVAIVVLTDARRLGPTRRSCRVPLGSFRIVRSAIPLSCRAPLGLPLRVAEFWMRGSGGALAPQLPRAVRGGPKQGGKILGCSTF